MALGGGFDNQLGVAQLISPSRWPKQALALGQGKLGVSLSGVGGAPATHTFGQQTISTINAIGDSYTDTATGSGPTDAAHYWISLVNAHFGSTNTNSAITGTVLQNSDDGGGSARANNGRDRYAAAMCGSNKKQWAVVAYGF